VITRPWLWLNVVVEASWVRVAEAVWVMTGGNFLAPANFYSCRKAGGLRGFRTVAGKATKGNIGRMSARTGLGESKSMVKTGKNARWQWFTPVILTSQEAEIRRISVQGQPGQRVCETLSRKYLKQKIRASRVA
jgi:hypothetical protein